MTTGKMKATRTSETCTVCDKKSTLTRNEKGDLCPTCMSFVKLLQSKPDALQKLAKMAGASATTSIHTEPVEQELPDVLDGVRHRTTDRERNTWYVSISELDGNPVEIFASTAFDRDHHLQSRISNLTTITRLISLILRHVFIGEKLTLEKTLIQLERSSRQPNDLPDMLGKILAKHKKELPTPNAQKVVNKEATVS